MEIPEIVKKIYIKFLDTLQELLIVASFFLVLYMFVLQPHQVDGLSMYPTFKNKELLLSYLLDVKIKNFLSFRHGDVIVFHSPIEQDKLYIKRIIGMPGDRIRVDNGSVYLNEKKLDESGYLASSVFTYGGSFLHDGATVTVPPDSFLVMGDNRPGSSDSRAWGFVSYDKLIGRSMMRIWPPTAFTVVKRDPYK